MEGKDVPKMRDTERHQGWQKTEEAQEERRKGDSDSETLG